jgi:Flp pilus assembly protein TadB
LVTTFVVLLLTVAFTSGLQISSLVAWIIAPLIIWLVSVLAGILLPMVLFKKALAQQRSK